MFWMFPVTAIAYLDRGQLHAGGPESAAQRLEDVFALIGATPRITGCCITRASYLMAQLWPDEPGDTWYTGKSSEENFREARDWIESWVQLTTRRGQGEYDSTHYMGVYCAADVVSGRVGQGSR